MHSIKITLSSISGHVSRQSFQIGREAHALRVTTGCFSGGAWSRPLRFMYYCPWKYGEIFLRFFMARSLITHRDLGHLTLLEHSLPIRLFKKIIILLVIAVTENFNIICNLCQKLKGNKLLWLYLYTKGKAMWPFCLIRSLWKKFCVFIRVYKLIRETFVVSLVGASRIVCLLKHMREDEIPKAIL